MQEIETAIGNADIEPGNPLLLFLPVLRVLHHARKSALHPGFPGGMCAVRIERGDATALSRTRQRWQSPDRYPRVRWQNARGLGTLISTWKATNQYYPCRETVTFLTVPSMTRLCQNSTHPILGKYTCLPSTLKPWG